MPKSAHYALTLSPDPQGELALAETEAACQALSRWLDGHVPPDHSANLVALNRAWYEPARAHSPLPAQMVTLALRDWVARARGLATDGVPYDAKLFTIRGLERISLATVQGRLEIACALAGYVTTPPGPTAARLVHRGGGWEFRVEIEPDLARKHRRDPMIANETVLARVGRVIAGLTHAAVDAAEQASPAAVLEQAIREIDHAGEEVRLDLGRVLAERHRIDLRLAELRTEHADLEARLRAALEEQREDLARAGIGRQLDIEAQIELLTRARAEKTERVADLEDSLGAVQASRREAEERLRQYRLSRSASAGGGERGGAADGAPQRLAHAQATVSRITGIPADIGTDRRSLDELEELRRRRAVQERLDRLKADHG